MDSETDKKREEIKKIFSVFDREGKGTIDVKDYLSFLNALNSHQTYGSLEDNNKVTEEETKQSLKTLDPNNTGRISFEDFYQYCSSDKQSTVVRWWPGSSKSPSTMSASLSSASSSSSTTTEAMPLFRNSSSRRISSANLPPPFARQLSAPLDRLRSGLNLDQILPFGGGGSSGKMKETYFCEICFSYDEIEKAYMLRSCGHRFCKECLTGWLNSKISDGQVDLLCFAQIKKEEKKEAVPCGSKITEEDILACIPSDMAEKYHRFKENLLHPDTRQCSKCGFSQGGDPKNPMMICEKCGHKYCYDHGDQHPNTNCVEYERTHRRENLINAALIAKITKPCPKCKSPIQKRSGCNHMKCPKCRASFCWLCGSEIEDKPLPDHFKETNVESGCRGKQFGQQRQVGPCGRCVGIFILLVAGLLGLALAPPIIALALATTLIFTPCFFCCAQQCTLSDYWNFFKGILGLYWILVLYFLLFIFGLISVPFCCLYSCYRGLGGRPLCGTSTEAQDEDDQMARQFEEEAAREVNSSLPPEEKVADMV